MASSINASTTAGVVTTADTSGVLNIQTAGTTAISIDASQAVSFTNSPTVTGGTANGVAYLNGSKVLTTGSALVFDGSNLGLGVTPPTASSASYIWNRGGCSLSDGPGQGYYPGVQNAVFNSGFKYVSNGFASSYAQGSGSHLFASAVSGTAGNPITFTQVLGVQLGNTLALEGATSKSGTGITFPATPSGSSNVKTLDDYEEGTWAPTLGGTSTYNIQSGTYVKVGRVVTAWFDMSLSAVGTGTNNGSVTGLPFLSRSSSYPQGMGGCLGYFANLNTSAVAVFVRTDNNSTTVQLSITTAAQATVTDGPTLFKNTTRVTGTITYETN